MHRKLYIVLPLFILFMAGCSFSPNELKLAERVMETSPDSALHILQHMQSYNSLSNSNKALYGLLLYQALDKNEKPLAPDSILNYSLKYYEQSNDKQRLALCYFLKGRAYKAALRYDDATVYYLKTLDMGIENKNLTLLGSIYADMGYICTLQGDYKESLRKYQMSVDCFNKAKKPVEACYRIIETGRTFRFVKDYKSAHKYYMQALNQTNDSTLRGLALQEIGINYYWSKDFDSAKFYLRKSLHYPFKSTNYAIRCYTLADLYFDTQQYDSAFKYASEALKYPASFFTQRDCYRILANTEFKRANFKQMAVFMTRFQACYDSVRKIESQTKSTVLEDIHETNQKAGKTKQYLIILAWVLPLVIGVSLLIVFRLRKRNKGKEKQLEEAEIQISQKQSLLVESLLQKIQDQRSLSAAVYRKSNVYQREQMDRELYNVCLHINEWDVFRKLMDSTFKDLVSFFESKYPEVTHKELIWMCLFLIDIPTPDIAVVLETQPGSLYKLKQRLAQKLKLQGARELNVFLQNFSERQLD